MINLRPAAIIVFLVALFFGAVLSAPQSGTLPPSQYTGDLYKVKVLEPKPNQKYRVGQKIIVKVKTAAPEGTYNNKQLKIFVNLSATCTYKIILFFVTKARKSFSCSLILFTSKTCLRARTRMKPTGSSAAKTLTVKIINTQS